MDQESFNKFTNYDFNNNGQWQQYLKDIYPTPSYDKLDKLKRKWYKSKVDSNFDINYDQKPEQEQSSQRNNQGQQQQQQQQRQPVSYIYHLENMLKLFFFPAALALPGIFPKMITLAICLLGIIRNNGMIQFTKEYASTAFQSEFFQNLIYLVGIAIPVRDSYIYYLPLSIHFLSGYSEYMISTQHGLYMRVNICKRLFDYIKQNRQFVIIAKQKVEFGITLYIILGLFFGLTSIFQLILMIQYLGIKNKFNKNMKIAWGEIQGDLNSFSYGPYCPSILRFLIHKLIWGFNKLLSLL